jgi:hypothetical protein
MLYFEKVKSPYVLRIETVISNARARVSTKIEDGLKWEVLQLLLSHLSSTDNVITLTKMRLE